MRILSMLMPVLLWTFAHDAAEQREVNVYLHKSSAESEQNPLGLAPVIRLAPANAPARTAIEAILSGPNRTEIREGFRALDTQNLKLKSIENDNMTWHVRFASQNGKTWPGTLSPARFEQAVKKTLQQFPTVKKVVVYVDGRTDFASGR